MSRKIALCYGLGALACLLLAFIWPPVSGIALWPALALSLVAAAYLGLGAAAFGKRQGRLAPVRRVILAPYLAGLRLSIWLQTRWTPPFREIRPGLLLGRRLTEREAAAALAERVTAVLDLTAETAAPGTFRRLRYLNLPVLDLTAPEPAQLSAGVAFIERQRSRGKVYIHCALGLGRAACLVAAYLLAAGVAKTPGEAEILLRRADPRIGINRAQRDALARYKRSLASGGVGPYFPRTTPRDRLLSARSEAWIEGRLGIERPA